MERREVHQVFFDSGAFGGLQNFRYGGKSPVVDQETESIEPNESLADMEMPIHAATELFLAIVHMKSQYPLNTDEAVEFPNRFGVSLLRPDFVAGRKQMTRVQADARPIRISYFLKDGRQVLEPVPQATPLAGGVFQKDFNRRSDQFQRARERLGDS